jgi:hypothetical protein
VRETRPLFNLAPSRAVLQVESFGRFSRNTHNFAIDVCSKSSPGGYLLSYTTPLPGLLACLISYLGPEMVIAKAYFIDRGAKDNSW